MNVVYHDDDTFVVELECRPANIFDKLCGYIHSKYTDVYIASHCILNRFLKAKEKDNA